MRRASLLLAGAILTAGTAWACAQSSPPPSPPPPPPLSAESVEVWRNTLLLPAATQGDLAVLAQAYRALHPGLTRYVTLAEWDVRVDSLRRWFAEPRTRGETYLALARLTASIRCSHTYLNFWNQPRGTHRWLTEGGDKLPFTFALTDADHWVVMRSAAFASGDSAMLALAPGDTVVALNGVPTPELVTRMLSAVRGDGDSEGKRRSLLEFRQSQRYETTDVLLPLVLPPMNGAYTVTVRRGADQAGGRRDTVITVATTIAARRDAVARPIPAPRPAWSFTREGGVATLTVDGFEYGDGSEDWPPFVRQTFQSLRRDSVRTLIVDLRQNEGGSDEGAALLLAHLITAPLTLPAVRRYVVYDTVPAALRPLLRTWDRDFFDRRGSVTPRGDGTFDLRPDGSWPRRLSPSRNAFQGRIIVLTSYVNSSASHIMMRLLARRPNVTIIGEPTGGSLRASTGGNLFFLQLPQTGFEADVPLIAYDWGADQPSGGVQPDIRTSVEGAMERARQEAGGGARR